MTNEALSSQKFSQENLDTLKNDKNTKLKILKDIFTDIDFPDYANEEWYSALAHQKSVAELEYYWEGILPDFPNVAIILAKNINIDKKLLSNVQSLISNLKKNDDTRNLAFKIEDLTFSHPVFPELRYDIFPEEKDFYAQFYEPEKQRNTYFPLFLKNPNIPIDVLKKLVNEYDYKEAKTHQGYVNRFIKEIIDFNEEITKLSKCNSSEDTLQFWTKEPSNSGIKTQLSILSNPECPEPLLRYIYKISTEKGHAFDSLIMWYLQAVAKNSHIPEDLLEDLINYGKEFENFDVGQAFVNEVAAQNPSFNIDNFSEKIESNNRYVLKGALDNPSTSPDTKEIIEELLKNTETYPLHWMEISENIKTEALDVHPNRFFNNIQGEGLLVLEQIFCEDEDYEDFDIEELQQCYLEDAEFFIKNGVNDHANQTYFFSSDSYLDNTPSFFSISLYIPDYTGMSVNVTNVKDVIRDLIKDFWSKDLSSLIDEHGEWLSVYKDINHLFELLDSK